MVDVAVIGGGIVGLAHAVEARRRGLSVALFERSPRAVGASIRNFGMFWPIGQPAGRALARAMKSRRTYLELAEQAGFWADPRGSVHAAYHEDELECIRQFVDRGRPLGYDVRVVEAREALRLHPWLNPAGLRGALLSATEVCIDSFEVIPRLTAWLAAQPGVRIAAPAAVRAVRFPSVELADGSSVRAGRVFVCSGDDLETLYPEVLGTAPLTRCKLQMMRTAPQPGGWRLGAHLASGLSLRHYAAFEGLPALQAVRDRCARDLPHFDRWGIHVLASQTRAGELTIGDSHEYGAVHDPFNREDIDRWILDRLRTMLLAPDLGIAQRWSGQYLRCTDGRLEFVHQPEPGVTIVTGLGGGGMTLAFGLAQELFDAQERGEPWIPTPSAPPTPAAGAPTSSGSPSCRTDAHPGRTPGGRGASG